MLKWYKNYIISSDNEEDNNINESKPINKSLNKAKEEIKKNVKNNIYDQKFEESKKKKELNINDFDKNKEEKEETKIKKITYCELCDKRLENNEIYLLHMNSKRHKYKMKELLKKELKNCGSIRKVLIKEKMIEPHRRWRINNVRYLLYGFSLNRYLNK